MRFLVESIKSSLATKTGKAAQLAIIGQFLTGAFGFVLNVILIRGMSVDDYGLFSLFNASLMVLAGFIHFGWLETFVRYGSIFHEKENYLSVKKAIFNRVFTYSGIVTFITILLSAWISEKVLSRSGRSDLLIASAFGAWVTVILHFVSIEYRVRGLFKKYVWVQFGATLVRLVICFGLWKTGSLLLKNAVLVYVFAPLLFCKNCIPMMSTLPQKKSWELDRSLITEMQQYNKWIFIASLTYNLVGNISVQILAHYHDNAALSAFGVTARLTLPIYFVINAITTTVLPKLSSSADIGSIKNYLRRFFHFCIPATILILVTCWIAPPIMNFIAGQKYYGLESLMRAQVIVVLFVLLTIPVNLVLMAWGWSRVAAILNFIQLITNLIFGFIFIPKFGAMGAALTTLCTCLVNMVGTYVMVGYGIRKMERTFSS